MIRLRLFGLLMAALLAGGLAAADDPAKDQPEPPVRLKKKARPEPGPEKPPASTKKPEPPLPPKPEDKTQKPDKDKEPKEEPDEPEEDLEQKIKELTDRVAKDLQTAEERLDKKDAGDGTQQVQREVVKGIDELMEQMRRQQQQQQQQQQSSSSSQNAKKQAGKPKGGSGKQTKQTARGQRRQPSQGQTKTGQAGGSLQKYRNNQSDREMSKLADVYKDVWGHLPEALRQEMDQYSREQFMAKYNDLLKQYYATVAEKGRRKSD
jgi:hypothetical protein